jgi:hypothetical protein
MSDYPFEFKRFRFPVKLCFAVIINKAQGQSLKKIGIDLRMESFSRMWLTQELVLQNAYIYWRPQKKHQM